MSVRTIAGRRRASCIGGQPRKYYSQKRFEAALFFGSFLLDEQKK